MTEEEAKGSHVTEATHPVAVNFCPMGFASILHDEQIVLVGTNEELGRQMLADAKMDTASSLVEAAKMVIAASKVGVAK